MIGSVGPSPTATATTTTSPSGSVYREWKTQHIDDQLDDVFRRAFAGGLAVTVEPGTPLVWTIDPSTSACPDCEDNSLAGPVPAGEAFNYPRFSSGQEGPDARGSAMAAGMDGAVCFAEVNGDGKAWGAFQLGYAFDHQATSPSHCVVHVRLTAEEAGKSSRNDGAGEDASADGAVALVFFMKDSMGLTIKEESLVSSTLNRGPRDATTQYDFVFEADLQPERGYYVIVSGRVDASASQSATSRVDLKVSDVSMDIRWGREPGGAVRAASQGS